MTIDLDRFRPWLVLLARSQLPGASRSGRCGADPGRCTSPG
jgi:hypothetical protein